MGDRKNFLVPSDPCYKRPIPLSGKLVNEVTFKLGVLVRMDVLEVESRLALLRMTEDVFIFFRTSRSFQLILLGTGHITKGRYRFVVLVITFPSKTIKNTRRKRPEPAIS